MRLFYVAFLLIPIAMQNNAQCNNQNKTDSCFKGRLEIKGICSNYVISVIEGNVDTAKVTGNWTDPESGKNYKNVFKLNSPCTFPEDIGEGDEFYFQFTNNMKDECIVCMAYRPVPGKKNMIIVSKLPCR